MGACYSRALQSSQEDLEEFEIIRPVVVTGFGKLDPKDDTVGNESNFSWRVVEKLSDIIDYKGRTIPVIKGRGNPPEPITVCYSCIEDQSFKDWLDSTDALVYLHLGVNLNSLYGNHIYLETTGRIDANFGPDNCGDTPTHQSSKPEHLYPKLSDELETSFQIPQLIKRLKDQFKFGVTVKTCSANSIMLSFKCSDNAGTSLCDFLYYVSLDLATKRNVNSEFPRNVLLIHLPKIVCFQEDSEFDCTVVQSEKCESEKAEAIAEVIKFIIKELLAQVDAPKDHAFHTLLMEQ